MGNRIPEIIAQKDTKNNSLFQQRPVCSVTLIFCILLPEPIGEFLKPFISIFVFASLNLVKNFVFVTVGLFYDERSFVKFQLALVLCLNFVTSIPMVFFHSSTFSIRPYSSNFSGSTIKFV